MDAKTKARAKARAATQMKADSDECAARFMAFASLVTAHFDATGVPDDISNAALAASASLRTFALAVEAFAQTARD